jgi:hypothetical protein
LLHFLQPIWLFAIAGIIAPVAIHLWNNKEGKILPIGSIALLEMTSQKKARSRRISEWLLLLLRCFLLILLASLLAGPYWKKKPGKDRNGWVLVGIREGEAVRTKVDSLIKEGYERHDLKDSSWWEAFAGLDRQAPAGIPFYVFTDGYLRHFWGRRPVTDRPVYWYVDTVRDSTIRWVAQRWLTGSDSVREITGISGSTGITYGYEQMARRRGDSVDTTTQRVAVYSDGIDGQWVTAAIRAVQQFTRRNISVVRYALRDGGRQKDVTDWCFWLSKEPVPVGMKAANMFLYEPGKAIPVDTWIRDMDVKVEKVIAPSGQTDKLTPVWVDGFGRPLLGLEKAGGERRYHFFSHFDPAWNGLVWSAGFPSHLEALLFEKGDNAHDRRVIDPGQVPPGRGDAADGVAKREEQSRGRKKYEPAVATIDLAPAGWLLVWLLLLCERLVALKKNKNG